MNIHKDIKRDTRRKDIMDIQTGKKIVRYLGKEKVITSSELAKFLGVSWNTAEKYLLELVIEGEVVKIKKRGVNLWLLK
ncbi:hypothetical protein HOD75_04920 [archaeon]|jgi:Fic family protein|nr:hypothetical protein [archaeon]MBT4242207.1 hypothetical protein [archaeon]MBT4417895.1 hypothetical protein [archaeon]